MAEPLLETEGLTKDFDGITAVDDLSVSFDGDQLHAIIGPNGAGKTTLFDLLTGARSPSAGSIQFSGEDITDLGLEATARRGLLRSYQISQLFNEMTVLENVRVAVQSDLGVFDFWNRIEDEDDVNDHALEVLERVGLAERRHDNAGTLSHGDQRTLEIAVALGANPDLLLLDEPSSGMSPEETRGVVRLIEELAADKPIIFIEHKMDVVREVADRILVLHKGRVLADGSPGTVQSNDEVRRVYLGGQQI